MEKLNPYIEVIEVNNFSTERNNMFAVIFDNVTGVSGEKYTTN